LSTSWLGVAAALRAKARSGETTETDVRGPRAVHVGDLPDGGQLDDREAGPGQRGQVRRGGARGAEHDVVARGAQRPRQRHDREVVAEPG
jgi:hypothetical protein